ncbi:MAG: hypothetical protein ETSY1_05080 [Candidatus Entotheonella factor]|uniref:Uncharacterized protein n=1 Tax=Entotheonella factor TaxID=1429438 RepID=W4LVU8_ENTF1|nr:MAG: hypothetical protein ETSY1_05080 [Candidatus Entotheonella factor]
MDDIPPSILKVPSFITLLRTLVSRVDSNPIVKEESLALLEMIVFSLLQYTEMHFELRDLKRAYEIHQKLQIAFLRMHEVAGFLTSPDVSRNRRWLTVANQWTLFLQSDLTSFYDSYKKLNYLKNCTSKLPVQHSDSKDIREIEPSFKIRIIKLSTLISESIALKQCDDTLQYLLDLQDVIDDAILSVDNEIRLKVGELSDIAVQLSGSLEDSH